MRPADVLHHQRAFTDGFTELFLGTERTPESEHTLLTCAMVAEVTRDCPTYFVSSDMTTLAVHAAETLPPVTLTADLLTSRAGWMLYDKPFAELAPSVGDRSLDGEPLAGMCWTIDRIGLKPDDQGDERLTEPGAPGARLTQAVFLWPLIWQRGLAVPGASSWRDLGTDLTAPEFSADGGKMERRFWATHLLMQQSLAWVERDMPDRAARRRAARAGLPAQPVTVIRLRRIDPNPSHTETSLIEWTHRWMVGGHWRQQVCGPGRSQRRPTWIGPHIKGPPCKPLVLKGKVTAWVR